MRIHCTYSWCLICVIVVSGCDHAVSSQEGTSSFTNAKKNAVPTLKIEARIGEAEWSDATACDLHKEQQVSLRLNETQDSTIRWYQIQANTKKIYKNANHPWEAEPYKWVGLGSIDYTRTEIVSARDKWEIIPLNAIMDRKRFSDTLSREMFNPALPCTTLGTFWIQAEVLRAGIVYRSPGIEDAGKGGLALETFRISVRNDDSYLGHLTSFLNVPGVFGSTLHQSTNYLGVDCADVLMSAYGRWKGKTISKNHNVGMLMNSFHKQVAFDYPIPATERAIKWGTDILPGDVLVVKYPGARQFQHVGALYADANGNAILDDEDIVMHAGPQSLHCSLLEKGHFNGHVVVVRPE